MTDRTTFTRIVLPTLLSQDIPHFISPFFILSRIPYHTLGEVIFKKIGIPIYLNSFQFLSSLYPKISSIFLAFCTYVFQVKMWLFPLFVALREAFKKFPKEFLNILEINVKAPLMRMVSSTNCPCFMFFIPEVNLMPRRLYIYLSHSNRLLRESAIIILRKGERGHPYLIPLVVWKNCNPSID